MTARRALVLWADPNSPNHGVSLLARGLARGLGESISCEFASHRIALAGQPLSLKALIWGAVSKRSSISRAIAEFDLVVDVGEGDSFASIYGWKRFGKMVFSKLAVARAGVPLVIAPQTLGPWHSLWSRVLARRVMRAAVEVWARDSASERRANSVMSGHATKRAHDLSFGLAEDSRTGSIGGPRRMLMNVSGLLWNPNPHVDSALYQRTVRAAITHAQANGVEVALMPHVYAPGAVDDDVAVSEALGEEFSVSVELHHDLDSVRGAITHRDLVVASRMHACLNALTKGVPCIALAYSDKFAALFQDIDYPHHADLRVDDESEILRQIVSCLSEDSELLLSRAEHARDRGAALVASFFDSVRATAR